MIKKGFLSIGIFFLHLFSFLPLWLLFGISNVLYYLVYYVVKYRRDVVRKNLVNSFPEKSLTEIITIEKRFYRYLTDLMVEIIKMSSISKAEVLKRVKMKNFDRAEAYFQKGESVLACSGHYGNWELGTMACGLQFSIALRVIYKPINNKIFEKWFNKLRTKFGNVFIPMRQTLREVIATKDQPTLSSPHLLKIEKYESTIISMSAYIRYPVPLMRIFPLPSFKRFLTASKQSS